MIVLACGCACLTLVDIPYPKLIIISNSHHYYYLAKSIYKRSMYPLFSNSHFRRAVVWFWHSIAMSQETKQLMIGDGFIWKITYKMK